MRRTRGAISGVCTVGAVWLHGFLVGAGKTLMIEKAAALTTICVTMAVIAMLCMNGLHWDADRKTDKQ
jgi:hypothetical protein